MVSKKEYPLESIKKDEERMYDVKVKVKVKVI